LLKEQAKLLNRMTIIADLSLVAVSFVIAFYFRRDFLAGPLLGSIKDYSWILLPALPIWYYLLAKYKLYQSIRNIGVPDLFYRIFSVHFFAGFFVSALILFFDRDFFSRRLVLVFVVASFFLIFTERICLKLVLGYIRRKGFNFRQLLIVGTKERAQEFIQLVENHADWGLRVIGVLQVASGDLKDNVSGYKVMGRLEDLQDCCKRYPVDEVVFCLAKDQVVDIEEHLQHLEELGVTVRMVLDFYKVDRYRRDLSFFENSLPILTFYAKTLDAQQLFLKRILDILGALIGLLGLLLLFPLVALGIKIESPGPVFYSQERVGESGRTFRIWKFRSMYMDADVHKSRLANQNEMKGAFFKMANDPRVTFVGKFLRLTSLDELPQFWNVLKGEMSLVGTRPPTLEELDQYENWHRRRISIKPGITGLWQVSGRSEIEDFDDVVKLDLQYIDNWSLGLDTRILLKTIWVVLARKGSS
jgi:exopolysaccharide biosynthesis polyprenyl glycosylphosphotransferase